MTDDLPTGAEVIARRLYEAGCRHAFGIPGGETLHLVDALERAGLRFVLTRHENGAGFMAEGMYYATGAPGVLVTTLGPGLTNAVTAVANALQERVPMIVLSARVDPDQALHYTHQIIDHAALLAPVVKASFTASPERVDVLVEKALAVACDERPGPVHIDLPISVATAPQRRATTVVHRRRPTAPAPGPDLDAARRLIATARRPLVIAGLDVAHQRAEAAFVGFVERLGAPVLTTYKAKGVLPEDHPLCLGAVGLSPKADAIVLPFVADSDLVLLVGYDPIEMRAGWIQPFGPEQTIVELAAAPGSHMMHQAQIGFVCDIAAGLRALEPAAGINAVRDDFASTKAALDTAFAAGDSWGPGQIVDVCRRVLPRDTVATADSGAHRILVSQMWRCHGARDLRQSSGFCTMGASLPYAMAAKLAEPHRPVVAFVGDGGLAMGVGELATARELGLSLVVVVFVDRSLALIEMKQRQSRLANRGVDFDDLDYVSLARGFGCVGHVVRSAGELETALARALGEGGIHLLACEIDRRAYDGLF